MARKFLTNIDMNKSEIQNLIIHKLATAPSTPVEGMIYYNTVDHIPYIYQTASWKDISGELNAILSTTNCVTIQDNADGTMSIDLANATTGVDGLFSSADKTILDASTNLNTVSTLVYRDASGDFSATNIATEGVTISSASGSWGLTSAVTKDYVDTLVTSGIKFLGTIDCSANPNYPSANAGDAYIAQPGGLIGGASGVAVSSGDWIIAINDNAGGDQASVGTDWDIIENTVGIATEVVSGTIRIATSAEATTGTDDTIAITPLTLAEGLASVSGGAKVHSEDLGNNSLTTFTINHAFNSVAVHMQLYEVATGNLVECDMSVTDANNCEYTFNVAPTVAQYKAVILG